MHLAARARACWTDDARGRRARGRAPHREAGELDGRAPLLRRPARRPARQDPGRRRGRRGAANGVGFTTTMLLKDTSHRTVFPVWHAGRRLRHEGAGGRGRRRDGARPDDLPRAALGAAHRLDAVRHLLPRRPADAVLHARVAARALAALARARLRLRRRPRGRVPRLQAREGRSSRTGDAGQPGEPPDVVAAHPGLPVPDRAALRRDGPDPRDPAHATSSISACRCARSRSSSGRARSSSPSAPRTGLEPADTMVLFRSAVKQIAPRHGYHATFMCRPRLAERHVQRLAPAPVADRPEDRRQRLRADADAPLSPIGTPLPGRPARARARRHRVQHADAQRLQALPALLARPRPRRLGRTTTAASMLRVLGGPGDPATASRTASASRPPTPTSTWPRRSSSGLDGLDRELDPGPSADTPYETKAPALPPHARRGARRRCATTAVLRDGFGDSFVDYYLTLKQAEIDRFDVEVTDWEQREYFALF